MNPTLKKELWKKAESIYQTVLIPWIGVDKTQPLNTQEVQFVYDALVEIHTQGWNEAIEAAANVATRPLSQQLGPVVMKKRMWSNNIIPYEIRSLKLPKEKEG